MQSGHWLPTDKKPAASDSTSNSGDNKTSTTLQGVFGDTSKGDCIKWSEKGTSGNTYIKGTPCDDLHSMEVAGLITMKNPPNHFPSQDEWRDLIPQECTTTVEAYLGKPINTDKTNLYVSGLFPAEYGWKEGDRKMVCGVSSYKGEDDPYDATREKLFRGKAASIIGSSN